MSAPPPPAPLKPRISEEIADVPTQRLYLVSIFLLLQAFKLSDVLFPSTTPFLDDLDLNIRLWKWIVLDSIAVAAVSWLRVPRLDWGWKGAWTIRIALIALNYALFGDWKLSTALFVPSALRSILFRTLGTTERTVRLSKVLGSSQAHLGGQFTVHILAVSTAHLSPVATCFCLDTATRHRKPEPVQLPLLLNNTALRSISYSVTPFGLEAEPVTHTIAVNALTKPKSSRPINQRDQIDDWVQGSHIHNPKNSPSSTSPTLHHRLPSTSKDRSRGDEDPLSLSSTQSLYYVPTTTTGIVRLVSVTDSEGQPVRIRRSREQLDEGDAKIVPCPRGGFNVLSNGGEEVHTCLSPLVADSRSLELEVSGWQPLSVQWRTRGGKTEKLEGITSGPSSAKTGEEVVKVPVNVTLDRAGKQTFVIDAVRDACGTSAYYGESGEGQLLPSRSSERTFVVHQPPEVAFAGTCGKGEDVRLLERGQATLDLKLSAIEQATPGADEWTIKVRFTPEDAEQKGWDRELSTRTTTARLNVDRPGSYDIIEVRSKWCSGLVLVPNSCRVVLQPSPTLETSFSAIQDVCNSEIGSLATLQLSGAPPFFVTYQLTDLATKRSMTKTEKIPHLRSTLRLEPGPGDWEYRFSKIKDAYYPGVDLARTDTLVRKQKVQLVGGAEWKDAGKGRTVHSCEGSTISVEVTLKGEAPWDLEYAVVGQPSRSIKGIKASPYRFDVDIPSPIAQRGGEFVLSLEGVRDGHGCRRPLTGQDLVIDVRRTKPTARFQGVSGGRSIVIREGEAAKIPLRLTGEGPWTIAYKTPAGAHGRSQTLEFVARQHNVDIDLRNPVSGTYTLLNVKDRFCPGDVSETDWTISTLPRPTLSLGASIGKVHRNGSVIRAPVCENKSDSVQLQLNGRAPFSIAYTVKRGSHHAEEQARTIQAIRDRKDFELFTAEAGHHTYTFTGVGDSLYSTPDAAGLEGKNGLLRIEQDVLPLPKATFKRGAKADFCINDKLRSRGTDNLVLLLEGEPPFIVVLEVKEEGHPRKSKQFTVRDITSTEWPVEVPFDLDTAAPHVVTVRHVRDGNGCEQRVEASADIASSALVSVAEVATMSPLSPKTTYCVGDSLDFVVQGAPPFTVAYDFGGKVHTVRDVGTHFSRLATAPGDFRILSVGHGDDRCKSAQMDIMKTVRPLPSAKVSHGDQVIVDIREGDQTEIVFEFTGTPPFSFTYSRRHPQDRTKDRTVLETHTVSNIMEHSYSIFTSQEGTWSVSYIADAYCSYPSNSAVPSSQKAIKQ